MVNRKASGRGLLARYPVPHCFCVASKDLPATRCIPLFSTTCKWPILTSDTKTLSPFLYSFVQNVFYTQSCLTVFGIFTPIWTPHAHVLKFDFLLLLSLLFGLLLAQLKELSGWEFFFRSHCIILAVMWLISLINISQRSKKRISPRIWGTSNCPSCIQLQKQYF